MLPYLATPLMDIFSLDLLETEANNTEIGQLPNGAMGNYSQSAVPKVMARTILNATASLELEAAVIGIGDG